MAAQHFCIPAREKESRGRGECTPSFLGQTLEAVHAFGALSFGQNWAQAQGHS